MSSLKDSESSKKNLKSKFSINKGVSFSEKNQENKNAENSKRNINYYKKSSSSPLNFIDSKDLNNTIAIYSNTNLIDTLSGESNKILNLRKGTMFENTVNLQMKFVGDATDKVDLSNSGKVFGTPSILVVDDDFFCRKNLKNLIKKIVTNLNIGPMNVIKASDGLDTLNLIVLDQMKHNQIRLVISDENMNYCNGSDSFSLLTKMFLTEKLRKIPLWILTALEEDNDLRVLMQKSGCELIMKKPVSKSSLEEHLRALFVTSTVK